MGAVDLVVQVESPPSVASRAAAGRPGRPPGRRGQPRGALPEVPRRPRADRRRRRAHARRARSRRCTCRHTPLDVLAQQIVAMCALDEWTVDDVLALARRVGLLLHAHPARCSSRCSTCSPGATPATSSPSCAPASSGTACPTPSPAAAAPSGSPSPRGGTIPDRGLYAVFLATGEGPGRRVGELDEEMVYESRVGDLFTLGTSTWRIEDITHDRVLVTPGARPARAAAVLEGRLARPPRRAGPGRRRVRPRGRGADARCRARAGDGRRARRRGPPTTCSATCASSARPPATCPTTGPSSSSGSATSSATGGSPSTRRSARRCTPRGRWP